MSPKLIIPRRQLATVALVAAPALAIGAVHAPVLGVIAVLAMLLAMPTAVRWASGAQLSLGPIGAATALLACWSTLQLVPLPAGLVAAIAPSIADAWAQAAQAMGDTPRAAIPLTLDTGRTAAVATGMWLLLLVYALAGRGRPSALLAVAVTGAALLLVGCLHNLAGANAILGLYRPSVALSEQLLPTTLVNPNHSGAMMMLATAAAFALSMERTGRPWLLLAAALTLGVVATESRANTTLVVGLIVLLSLRGLHWAAAVFGLLLAAAAAIALHLLPGSDTTFDHTNAWLQGLDVALAYPWTGAGGGGFAMASSALVTDWSGPFIAYPHNVFVRAAADWGFPVAIAATGLGGWGLARAARQGWRDDSPELVIVAALAALVIQNCVDLSLAVPGVAVPAAALAGWLEGPTQPLPSRSHRRPSPHRLAAAAVLMLTICTCTWLAVRDDPRAAGAHIADHPHAYLLWRRAAVEATEPETAELLIDHAVSLAPTDPDTRLLRTRLRLAAGDLEGAAADLVAVSATDGAPRGQAARLLLAHSDKRQLMELTLAQAPSLATVAGEILLAHNRTAPAEQILNWTAQRHPNDLALLEQLVRAWGRLPDRAADLDKLSTRLLAMAANADKDSRGGPLRTAYLVDGHRLRQSGNHIQAHHMFLAAARAEPDRGLGALVHAGSSLVAAGRPDRLSQLMPEIEDAITAQTRRPTRAAIERLRSRQYEARGDVRGAIEAAQAARRLLPGAPSTLRRLAALYDETGQTEAAARMRKLLAEATR